MKAAFYTAIEDDCIRKNPFNFALDTVLEDDTEEKVALTQEQEDRLLAFAGSDPVYRKYCDEIIVLLGTGLRISELCGLTVDLDFENRRIDVDHQLLRDSELGYYVDAPKTKNGVRQIPMSEKVYRALKRAVKNRGKAAPANIGGYTNFLFLNQSGLPKTASCYESMFQGLVRKYNKHHKPDEALPNITPHTMRHTFCTRLAQAGMNPKDLQYIMGHSREATSGKAPGWQCRILCLTMGRQRRRQSRSDLFCPKRGIGRLIRYDLGSEQVHRFYVRPHVRWDGSPWVVISKTFGMP